MNRKIIHSNTPVATASGTLRARVLYFALAGAITAMLSGCGGGGSTAVVAPPPPSGLSLDTAHVLAIAQQPSELGTPFPVGDGQLTLIDTSELTQPIAVASATGM